MVGNMLIRGEMVMSQTFESSMGKGCASVLNTVDGLGRMLYQS